MNGQGTDYVLAVDLGKRRDYTAIAIVQRTGTYTVRHLQRLPLGTSYTQAAGHIRHLLRRPELQSNCTLVVDATGAGEPVVDLLRASDLPCPLKPVLITA